MKLIIFTGPPASGKSSIAKFIAEERKIFFTSKDECKIKLFEKYGFKNHSEKKTLSNLGEKIMHEEIEEALKKNIDVIVDNNFKKFDNLREILKNIDANVTIICIYLTANFEKLAERYNERISSGNRHLALYTMNQYPIIDGVSEFHHKLTKEDVIGIEENVKEKKFGDNILEINTDNIEKDFQKICDKILNYIDLF